MIVDVHCHAGPGDGFTGPWDTRAPLGADLRRAAAAGIHRTIVFAAFHSDYRVANAAVARLVRRHRPRLWGLAFVHAGRDRGRIGAMVEPLVRGEGFRGIKLHRHDAPITREVCDVARRLRVPVLYDVTGDVASVELFAREYPDVTFVIPHLGSFAGDWKAHLAVADQLARHPNVVTDTSGVQRFDQLGEAVRRAGAHKVLFGSDGPWLHPKLELDKIRLLGLPPAEEALVLGGNALRVFGGRRAAVTSPRASRSSAAPAASGR